MRWLIVAVVVLAAPASRAADKDAESVEIPLEEIWALDMPGTRDIRDLNTPDNPIVDKVLNQIREVRKFDHTFVVRGEGADALREFLRVRTDHPYWNRMPADEPLSIVFYSKPTREHVVLASIERKSTRFFPRYRFAPREGLVRTPALALIPIGKLSPARFEVKIERLPAEEKDLDAGFEDPPSSSPSDVASSCFFHIVEGNGGTPEIPWKASIPLKSVRATSMPGTQEIRDVGSDADDALVAEALKHIRDNWNEDSGMVVHGEGILALREFMRRRRQGLVSEKVAASRPMTLVFFTNTMASDVHLVSISRTDREISVKYRFVTREDAEAAQHLALIPLESLPPERYVVTFQLTQNEEEASRRDQSLFDEINAMCQPFSFTVAENE